MKPEPIFALKKGTLIALACGAAFAVPQAAMSQQLKLDGHSLTLQGAVAAGIGRIKASGASAGAQSDTVARNVITTGQSNFRFSSSQKIDGPFVTGAGFQVETGLNMDDGSSGSSQGVLGTRNTGVGIRTTAGDLWFGKWDSAYKVAEGQLSVTSSSIGVHGSITGIIGNIGLGSGTGGQVTGGGGLADSTNFNRRQTNSLNYYSPTFSNTHIQLSYSPDEQTGAGVVPNARARLYSGAIIYANGPLRLAAGYERHDDFLWGGNVGANAFGIGSLAAGAGDSSNDRGYELLARYTFGNTTISGGWERLRWSQSGGAAALLDLEADHWYAGVSQALGGPHTLMVGYSAAGSYDCNPSTMCGSETAANQLNINYQYRIEKSTTLNFFWGRLNNDRQGNYKIGSAPAIVAAGAVNNPAGLTYTGYSFTIDTRF